jgi:hypothetical protein
MTILQEAEATVEERGKAYGHPLDHFGRLIGAINAVFANKLKEPFTPTDWPLIMMLDKIVREVNQPKRDNRVDIAGYIKTKEMLGGGE